MSNALNSAYAELHERLPSPVAEAFELCALPAVLDDELAVALVGKFTAPNGSPHTAVSAVKQLPFVEPFEGQRWRLRNEARAYVAELSRIHEERHASVHRYLADYFRSQGDERRNGDEPLAREMRWMALYHLAAFSPSEAVAGLDDLLLEASDKRRFADIRGVAQLAEFRFTNPGSRAELAYFQGRYLYALGKRSEAEGKFLVVVNEGDRKIHRAIASHLLGVTWMRRRSRRWLDDAVRILETSRKLLIELNDERGEAMVLVSLATAIVAIGGKDALSRAETLLRRSVDLQSRLGRPEGMLHPETELAGVLMRRGGPKRLSEAERLIRNVVKRRRERRDKVGEVVALLLLSNILTRMGSENLDEAERVLRVGLELAERDEERSRLLNALAGVLMDLYTERGDLNRLDEAQKLLAESRDTGKRLGDRRHEAMVVYREGMVEHLQGNDERAVELLRESIGINESLGLKREVRMVRERMEAIADGEPNAG